MKQQRLLKTLSWLVSIALLGAVLSFCPAAAQEPAVGPTTQPSTEDKARAEMTLYGRQWALAIAQGKERTPAAREARARYVTAARELGFDPDDALRPQLALLLLPQQETAAQQLAHEIAEGRGKGREAQRLRQRIAKLSRLSGTNYSAALQSGFRTELYKLAQNWVKEKMKARPNAAQLRTLERQMQRIAPIAGRDPRQVRRDATYSRLFYPTLSKLGLQLADELAAGRASSPEALSVQTQAKALGKRMDIDALKWVSDNARSILRERSEQTARAIVTEQNKWQPDEKKLQELQQQLARMTAAMGISSANFLRQAAEYWMGSAAYSLSQQLVAQKARENPDAAHVEFLQKKLEDVAQKRREQAQQRNPDYAKYETVERYLSGAEYQYWFGHVWKLRRVVVAEESLPNPDQENILRTEREIEKILSSVTPTARQQLQGIGTHEYARIWGLRDLLIVEYRKDKPNSERIQQIEESFVKQHNHDGYLAARKSGSYTRLPPVADPEEYGRWHVERLKVRVQGEKLDEKIKAQKALLAADELRALQEQRAKLARRENELRVRMGDPLLSIAAPENAQLVIALMPGGEVKRLIFNADSRKWEARFDVPTYASEGEYSINVIIVLQDGTRQTLMIRYHVDVTPPHGNGQAEMASAGDGSTPILRLELDGSEDTARVFALLPWGDKVELKPSALKQHGFFALAPVPSPHIGKAIVVTYIITDRAHNRTTLTVDMAQ